MKKIIARTPMVALMLIPPPIIALARCHSGLDPESSAVSWIPAEHVPASSKRGRLPTVGALKHGNDEPYDYFFIT